MKNLLLFICTLMGCGLYAQTTWYVDQANGSDSNDGLSPASAFADVDKVFRGNNAVVSPGDTVEIMGEYHNESYDPGYSFDYGASPCDPNDGDDIGNVHIWHAENSINIRNVNGAPGAYITIRPHNGNTILKGDGGNIFRVAQSSYLRVEGFTVRGEAPNITLREAFAMQFLFYDPDNVAVDFNPTPAEVDYYVPLCSTPFEVEAMTFDVNAYPNGTKRPSRVDTRGMYFTDCHHIDVIGCDIQDMPGGGLRFAKAEYINIIDNEVAYNSSRSFTGTHGLVVTLASYQDFGAASLDNADPDDDDLYRIKILRNTVHHNFNEVYSYVTTKPAIEPRLDEGKGISLQRNETATWVGSPARFLVANNVSYWNGFSGVHTNDGQQMDFINNTCYMNSYTNTVTYQQTYLERFGEEYDVAGGWDPYDGTDPVNHPGEDFYEPKGGNIGISAQGSEDIKIKNNISVIDGDLERFPLSTDADNTNNYPTPAAANLTIENNIIYVDDPAQIGDLRQDPGIQFSEVNTLVADPLFNNPAGFDFSLQAGSPAIDYATTNGAPADDYLGLPRDATPDAGAIEVQPVLPVDLVVFTANPVGKTVRLNWTTAAETNNDYFTVEHSTNGVAWTPIGRVSGRGTFIGVAGYTFVDQEPITGSNYYRLRQIDFDGSSALSGIRIIDFAAAPAFAVFPNPVSDWVTISGMAEGVAVKLIDGMGRELTSLARREIPGGLSLDVSDLPTGVYYILAGEVVQKLNVR